MGGSHLIRRCFEENNRANVTIFYNNSTLVMSMINCGINKIMSNLSCWSITVIVSKVIAVKKLQVIEKVVKSPVTTGVWHSLTVISMCRNLQEVRKQFPSCQRLQTISLPNAAGQCRKGQLSPCKINTIRIVCGFQHTGFFKHVPTQMTVIQSELTLVQVE